MPALAGSPCDTITSLHQPVTTTQQPQLNVYFAAEWEKAFINAHHLKGKSGTLEVYSVNGALIHQEHFTITNGNFTRDYSMAGMADGMYLITVTTDAERISHKLVKY